MPKGWSSFNQAIHTCRHCGAGVKGGGIGPHERFCQLKPEERFWRNVTKGEGCWEYTSSAKPDGYRFFRYRPTHGAKQVQWYAHRYSWFLANGPIPAGLDICHRCDNTACVRPDHLFVGTASDNMLDMHRKGRNSTVALKPEQVREIRERLAGEQRRGLQAQLAAEYKVSRTVISCINMGHTYGWVK